MLARVPKMLVLKKAVEVAEVPVAVTKVRFWIFPIVLNELVL